MDPSPSMLRGPSAVLAGSQGLLECPVRSGLKHHQPDGSQLLKCWCQYQREDARQPLASPENTVPTQLRLRGHSLPRSWLRALKGTRRLPNPSLCHSWVQTVVEGGEAKGPGSPSLRGLPSRRGFKTRYCLVTISTQVLRESSPTGSISDSPSQLRVTHSMGLAVAQWYEAFAWHA